MGMQRHCVGVKRETKQSGEHVAQLCARGAARLAPRRPATKDAHTRGRESARKAGRARRRAAGSPAGGGRIETKATAEE